MCPDNIITPTWTLVVVVGVGREFKMYENVILIPLAVNYKSEFYFHEDMLLNSRMERRRRIRGGCMNE